MAHLPQLFLYLKEVHPTQRGELPTTNAIPDVASKPTRRPGPVAFMHVPKTGGNAIADGLRESLKPTKGVFGWDMSNFGAFRDIDSFAPHLRRHIYPNLTDMRADADFVTGHMAYSSIVARYADIQCITILREPMSRLLSQWMFERSHGEGGVQQWGSYAPQQRLARRSLAEYLCATSIVSQTDNIFCRKLLWPSPLVPEDRFIEASDDAAILRQAGEVLARFDFVDLIENPGLPVNLGTWLGTPFSLHGVNETVSIPKPFQVPLAKEFTSLACAAMQSRCRLDGMLWESVVASRMNHANPGQLHLQFLMRNVCRYALLMAR